MVWSKGIFGDLWVLVMEALVRQLNAHLVEFGPRHRLNSLIYHLGAAVRQAILILWLMLGWQYFHEHTGLYDKLVSLLLVLCGLLYDGLIMVFLLIFLFSFFPLSFCVFIFGLSF